MIKETEIEFELEKETKNTIRYKEENRKHLPIVIGSLYIQKSYFEKEIPKKLSITIKTEE